MLMMRAVGSLNGARQKSVRSGHEVSNVRTSKTAWLSESLDSLLPFLSKRISLITGLTTNFLKMKRKLLQA